MSVNSQPGDRERHIDGENPPVEFDRIEGSLRGRIDQDQRVQSGVPENERRTDVDFIVMSGLTRPEPENTADDHEFAQPRADRREPRKEQNGNDTAAEFASRDDKASQGHGIEPEPEPEPLEVESEAPQQEVSRQETVGNEALDGEADATASEEPRINPQPRAMDFAEAEMFLQALEAQPREGSEPEEHPVDATADGGTDAAVAPETVENPETGGETDADYISGNEDAIDLPARENRRRHTRRHQLHGRSRARRRVRLATACIGATAAAASLIGIWLWLQPAFSTPEARFAAAQRLSAAGRFAQASYAFGDFAAANPQHTARGEAQFLAGLCAAIAPARDFDEEQALARRALALFEDFLRDNPAHAKAARAMVLSAQQHYRLEQHQQAVAILRDPELRLRDPESAVPGLRTLARSYVRLGEYEAAVSAYQQAAALAGNYGADADYEAIGDVFKLRADRAANQDKALEMQRQALRNWSFAGRVPGIDPADRTRIQEKIKWLEAQSIELTIPHGQQMATTGADASTVAEASAGAEGPRPGADVSARTQQTAVDPEAEARFLDGTARTDQMQ